MSNLWTEDLGGPVREPLPGQKENKVITYRLEQRLFEIHPVKREEFLIDSSKVELDMNQEKAKIFFKQINHATGEALILFEKNEEKINPKRRKTK